MHEPATAARITAAERLAPRVAAPSASIALAVLAAALPDGPATWTCRRACSATWTRPWPAPRSDAWQAARAIAALHPELVAAPFAELRPSDHGG